MSFSASTNVEADTAGPEGGEVPNAGGAPGVSAVGFGAFPPQPAAAPMTASEEYFKNCLRDSDMIFSPRGRESKISLRNAAFRGCGKSKLFCHSERSEESLFGLTTRKEREIPRFARNDKRSGSPFSATCSVNLRFRPQFRLRVRRGAQTRDTAGATPVKESSQCIHDADDSPNF
jgi:hypothetical protein